MQTLPGIISLPTKVSLLEASRIPLYICSTFTVFTHPNALNIRDNGCIT